MNDQNDSEERRNEGVRIIGAQEAAEAAGRPDVVRRRRRSEKRFGDRPDAPAATSDMPKIKISTTEPSDDPTGVLGTTPVVRPSSPGSDDRDGRDSADTRGNEDGHKFGHARIVEGSVADDALADDEDLTDVDDEPVETWDSTPWSDSEGGLEDPDDWDVEEPNLDDDDLLGANEDEESFVLPHWTEPATGQVPKVVAGTDFVDDQLTGSQPRWHAEGERGGETDFADLIDDGPRLGALGGGFDDDDPDYFDDDFDDYDDDYDDEPRSSDDQMDFFEQEEPVLEEFDEPRPRRQRRHDNSDSGGGESSGSGDRNLVQAAAVGLGLAGVGILCFVLGGLATTLLVMVILLIAAAELIEALESRGFFVPRVLALPAVAGLLLSTYYAGVDAYPVVVGLTVITGMLWFLWITPGKRMARDLGATLLVVMWIGFLGSFATLILGVGREVKELDPLLKSAPNPGIWVLITAVLVTVSHDVGAYFAGKHLGKTPMSSASPNKTLEGLAGGVLAGIIVPMIIVGAFKLGPIGESMAQTVIFSAFCAVVAPLGDLCQSAVKRDLKIKDMGTILPGHGGVLDRFDAMLFVLPTAYFLTLLMGIWTISAS